MYKIFRLDTRKLIKHFFWLLFILIQFSIQSVSSNSRNNYKESTLNGKTSSQKSAISIEPPILNFGERAMCLPAIENIKIKNNLNKDITISSIFTDSIELNTGLSFKQKIASHSYLNLSIVFSARTLGILSRRMTIHTDVGSFNYDIQAVGIHNPYNIQPILGIKVPASKGFQYTVQLYNPHSTPLKILEIFTTGGFLHLSPIQENSNLQQSIHRTIPSYQTTDIVNLKFTPQVPAKYQGIVNIKTSRDQIVIPVEFSVVQDGIHILNDVLDFGTLVFQNEQKFIPLRIFNSKKDPVLLTSLTSMSSKDDDPISVKFSPMLLPNGGKEVNFANVSVIAKTEGHFSGTIHLRTNDTNLIYTLLSIPYQYRVLFGKLSYNLKDTYFLSGTLAERKIPLINNFPAPISFHSMELDNNPFQFRVRHLPVVLSPGGKYDDIAIKLASNCSSPSLITNLIIRSNISDFYIPFQCYSGRLSISIDKSHKQTEILDILNVLKQNYVPSDFPIQMDFGVIGIDEKKTIYLIVANNNPVSVNLNSIQSTKSKHIIEFEGMVDSLGSFLKLPKIQNDKKFIVSIEPNFSAIFSITVIGSKNKEEKGRINLKTPYENVIIKTRYKIMEGIISNIDNLPILISESAFIGKTSKFSFSLKSTFSSPVQITSISSSDPRIIPVIHTKTLEPNNITEIGQLIFDPSQNVTQKSYLVEFNERFLVSKELTNTDLHALKMEELEWERLAKSGELNVKAVLTLETNLQHTFSIPVHAFLSKPTIILENVKFPLTEVGSTNSQPIYIHNPSEFPLLVQILPIMDDNKDSFSISEECKQLQLIQPKAFHEIGTLYFSPKSNKYFTSNLFVKNNLTIVDSIPVFGYGGSGNLVFRNIKNTKPELVLNFELSSKDLQKCQKKSPNFLLNNDKHLDEFPNIVKTREFTVTNQGNLAITVEKILIDDLQCDGYGFHFHNCTPFTLQPAEVQNICISFKPDFRSVISKHELKLITNQTIIKLPLVGMVPYQYLFSCSNFHPQFEFETTLQRIIIFILILLISGFICVSFFEFCYHGKKYLLHPITFVPSKEVVFSNSLEFDNATEHRGYEGSLYRIQEPIPIEDSSDLETSLPVISVEPEIELGQHGDIKIEKPLSRKRSNSDEMNIKSSTKLTPPVTNEISPPPVPIQTRERSNSGSDALPVVKKTSKEEKKKKKTEKTQDLSSKKTESTAPDNLPSSISSNTLMAQEQLKSSRISPPHQRNETSKEKSTEESTVSSKETQTLAKQSKVDKSTESLKNKESLEKHITEKTFEKHTPPRNYNQTASSDFKKPKNISTPTKREEPPLRKKLVVASNTEKQSPQTNSQTIEKVSSMIENKSPHGIETKPSSMIENKSPHGIENKPSPLVENKVFSPHPAPNSSSIHPFSPIGKNLTQLPSSFSTSVFKPSLGIETPQATLFPSSNSSFNLTENKKESRPSNGTLPPIGTPIHFNNSLLSNPIGVNPNPPNSPSILPYDPFLPTSNIPSGPSQLGISSSKDSPVPPKNKEKSLGVIGSGKDSKSIWNALPEPLSSIWEGSISPSSSPSSSSFILPIIPPSSSANSLFSSTPEFWLTKPETPNPSSLSSNPSHNPNNNSFYSSSPTQSLFDKKK